MLILQNFIKLRPAYVVLISSYISTFDTSWPGKVSTTHNALTVLFAFLLFTLASYRYSKASCRQTA